MDFPSDVDKISPELKAAFEKLEEIASRETTETGMAIDGIIQTIRGAMYSGKTLELFEHIVFFAAQEMEKDMQCHPNNDNN